MYESIRYSVEPYMGSLSYGFAGLVARSITVLAMGPIERYKTQSFAAQAG